MTIVLSNLKMKKIETNTSLEVNMTATKTASELTHEGLLELLKHDIGSKALMVIVKMQAVLTTPQLRWEFVERFDNRSYRDGAFDILCKMRKEKLSKQTEQDTTDFLHNYRFDPIQAISKYIINFVPENMYEDWLRLGGTPEKLVQIKKAKNTVTLQEAIMHLRRMNKNT